MNSSMTLSGEACPGIGDWPLGKSIFSKNESYSSCTSLNVIESVSEGSHSELLSPNTAYLVRMDLPFSDENFGNTDKAVVDLGWMDWEAWLRDDDRAMLSLMQEFQCLHHLYLREPAHRAKSLDDVLTAKLRKIQPGNDIYIGISELGFPKIIAACKGSLLVVGMPAIKAVEHFESEDLLQLVSCMQKASADDIVDNGGCFVCLKKGDVLAVPSFWIVAHDALEENTIVLASVSATKRQLVEMDTLKLV